MKKLSKYNSDWLKFSILNKIHNISISLKLVNNVKILICKIAET